MKSEKFVKIVVGGWWAKRNYRTNKVVFYGYINKETPKAIMLADVWIPKECIEKIENFDKAILDKVVEEAETEEEAIKMLNEEGETFVCYDFRYNKASKRWEGYAVIY